MRKAWTQAIVALSLAGLAALVMISTNALSDSSSTVTPDGTKAKPEAKGPAKVTLKPDKPKPEKPKPVKPEAKTGDTGTGSEIPSKPKPGPDRPAPSKGQAQELNKGKRLMYTTYFYTAGEAVVHGYSKNTKVRIVSLKKGGTVWKGVVSRGQTKLVRTGQGASCALRSLASYAPIVLHFR